MVGGAFSLTSKKIRPSIFGSNKSKSGRLILDVRSIVHDSGTDNAAATFTGPKVIFIKALMTVDSVFGGVGRVRAHFSANSTIVF